MHAIRLHEFGPAENLRYESVADPQPGPGQVRIAVRAAGVHVIDTSIRAGDAPPGQQPDLPVTPGRDVAGVVDALGPGADPTWLGRPVVAYLGLPSGGYAELAVAPAASLHALPDGVAFDTAVALIGTGRTTLAVLEVAAIGPADVVLITAAAGGIGSLAVQAAKLAGATVIGAAGGAGQGGAGAPARRRPRGRLHPAGLAARRSRPRSGTGRRRWPWTASAAQIGRAALELLGVGGRLVLYGWSSGEPTPLTTVDLFARGISASAAIGARIFNRPGGIRDLEEKALAAAGTLVPLVQHFPLAEAAKAHAAIAARATTGKVVLIP